MNHHNQRFGETTWNQKSETQFVHDSKRPGRFGTIFFVLGHKAAIRLQLEMEENGKMRYVSFGNLEPFSTVFLMRGMCFFGNFEAVGFTSCVNLGCSEHC